MRNIKAVVQYDGSRYYGFQAQLDPDNIPTVQEVLEEAIGGLLKEPTRVHSAGRTDSGVHALGQVVHFYTESRIPVDKLANAINQHLPQDVYRYPGKLDDNLMLQACKLLEGTHNYQGFCSAGSTVKNFVRTVYYMHMRRDGDWLIFDVYGNGFLYNMVRIMVGTVLDIGKGRKPLHIIPVVLDNQKRHLAGRTAPASGLYLKSVFYP